MMIFFIKRYAESLHRIYQLVCYRLAYLFSFVIVMVILLFSGCKPVDVDPELSNFINTVPGELTFTNQSGDNQIVSVTVKRSKHGTGPFGPEQRNIYVTYLPPIANFKFNLEIDGEDGPQYLTVSLNDQNTIFLLPCENGYDCEKVRMHDQISVNGKTFRDIIAVSMRSFSGAITFNGLTPAQLDQGFDSLYLGKKQGFVAFTTNKGEVYSLVK